MPSDLPAVPGVLRACQALMPVQHALIAACESALAQGRAWCNDATADEDERAKRIAAELGRFAAGHVDPRRFGAFFAVARDLAPAARTALVVALGVLRDTSARNEVAVATVPRGGSLSDTVGATLAEAGRAFAAARVVDWVRSGPNGPDQPPPIAPLPFHQWTRAERRYAPPLVVTVAGADAHVAALGDFADGRQKIILVVDGICAPAPLVRLVTPGTFVMQTSDAAALDAMTRVEAPAIAAIVPESAAAFTHDPAAGAEPWQRLSIQRLPTPPFSPVPGMSTWQLREDLRQLQALAAAPASEPIPPAAAAVANTPDAVERLAAWLLSQSGLSGPP